MSKFKDGFDETRDSGPDMQTCEHCSVLLPYPSKKGDSGVSYKANRIIGRTENRGYVCRDCIRQERDWREDSMNAFYAKHKDDDWGSLCRASRDLPSKWNAGEQGKAEVSAFIDVMKKKISAGMGAPLPYDPDKREQHVSRESSLAKAIAEAETV